MVLEDFHKRPTLVGVPGEDGITALPKQIGSYKIESLLNRGGMSVLYLGIHPETHEPIAIKVLSSSLVSNPEMVERFMREAEIIELTNHPNIVKLYGHGRWEGGVFIGMEFIQGLSLRQIILQSGLPLRRALEIILQISYALTHLHAHGIIHRDLKPENILLTAQGGVKVIDFGISAIYSHPELGATRQLLGTPVYMSPEQREDPMNVSFSSDVYSLGIIAYELILGRLSHGVVHLSLIPKGLQKILGKALQPRPQDRYEDIVDFVKEISSYLSSDEIKKDMRGTDYIGEMGERLKDAQSILLPAKAPQWRRVEIGFIANPNVSISSVYYDFFQPKEGVYCVVMGESLTTGVEGLLHTAILKGMLHSLARIIDNPTELIATLNRQIYEDYENLCFSFAYLTLVPSAGSFSFISCGYSPLWHLPTGADVPRRISADNVALGLSAELDVIEVDSNWNVGDVLIFHTFQAGTAKAISEMELDESLFLQALMENLYLAPQKQVEAIFRKVSKHAERSGFERSVTLISLMRNE